MPRHQQNLRVMRLSIWIQMCVCISLSICLLDLGRHRVGVSVHAEDEFEQEMRDAKEALNYANKVLEDNTKDNFDDAESMTAVDRLRVLGELFDLHDERASDDPVLSVLLAGQDHGVSLLQVCSSYAHQRARLQISPTSPNTE